MTGEDDTGQPARLPLMKRAKFGIPIEETELTPEQIAEFEFPTDREMQSWWRNQIEQAVKARQLAAHVEKTVTVVSNGVRLTKKYRDDVLLPGSKTESVPLSSREQSSTRKKYFISRNIYADWRTDAAIFHKPLNSYINSWLSLSPVSVSENADFIAPQLVTLQTEQTGYTEASQLSLTERAKQGLLTKELELWLFEIMELEFPGVISTQDYKRSDYIGWEKNLDAAIRFGLLGDGPYRKEICESRTYYFDDDGPWASFHPTVKSAHAMGYSAWRIPREPYRTWRATQPNPPAGSIVHLWLGATVVTSASKSINLISTEEIKYRIKNKLSIRNPCSVHYWPTVEWWTLEQISFIFIGQEPIDDDDLPHGAPFPWKNVHPASKRLYEALRAAVEVGTISAIPITRNGRDSYRVKNIDAYRWLRQIYKETVHVPTELVEFFEATALLTESEQAEPLLTSSPRPDTATTAKHAAVDRLLEEIDERAKKQGKEFNRHSLPGTKAEFIELLKQFYPSFNYMSSVAHIDRSYLSGKCQFQRGAHPGQNKGKSIWALFPEYSLK